MDGDTDGDLGLEALIEDLGKGVGANEMKDLDLDSGTGISSIVGLVGRLEGAKDSFHKWDLSLRSQSFKAGFVNFLYSGQV